MHSLVTFIKTKFVTRTLWLGVLLLSLGTPCFGETLERLESITARYATLNEFLENPAAVLEYRDALKLYMGEDETFDPVYDEFIRQIKEVQAKIPAFSEQAWALNPNWKTEGFRIEGEHAGSGLDIKRENLLAGIERLKEETKQAARLLIDDKTKVAEFIAELKSVYDLLPEKEAKALKRGEAGRYRKRLLGNEEEGIPKISEHPAAKALAAYAAHSLFNEDERFSDAFYSGDADIIVDAVNKVSRLADLHEAIGDLGVEIPKEILSYLKFDNRSAQAIREEYAAGIASMKQFRAVADAKIDPDLLARMQALQAEGIEPAHISENLDEENRTKLHEWQRKATAIRAEKEKITRLHNERNAFFSYAHHEDAARGTLRLKSDTATTLEFIVSPRAFHAFFAGRKSLECVGGRDCGLLAPKRWARAALKGTTNFFTEKGDGKMEGMVALTPLQRLVEGKPVVYEVMDLMSRAIKGDVIVRDSTKRLIKYSMFDQFIDRYRPRSGVAGLVISDGTNVSQNIGGGEVVNYSPAYLEHQVVGTPEHFSPADPMAAEISKYFPKTYMEYGRGGMIYDGMRGDGTEVVRLVPTRERKKWTQQELEDELMEALLLRKEITDRSILWKRAKESGVPLESFRYYRSHFDKEDSPLVKRALDRLANRLIHEPGTESAVRAAAILVGAMAPKRPHPLLLPLIDRLLKDHPGSEAAAVAVRALKEGINHHDGDKNYLLADRLALLGKNFSDYPGTPAAIEAIITLRFALASHPDPSLSKEIVEGYSKNLIGYPGTPIESEAADALVAAMFIKGAGKFFDKKTVDALAKFLSQNPDSEAMDNFAEIIKLSPSNLSTSVTARILRGSPDYSTTAQVFDGLPSGFREEGTPERMFSPGFIRLIRKYLKKYPGTSIASDAVFSLWALLEEQDNRDGDKSEFLKPRMVRALTDALYHTQTGEPAAGVFSILVKEYPQEEKLFGPKIIRGLVENIQNAPQPEIQTELFLGILKKHPDKVLLHTDIEVQNFVSTHKKAKASAIKILTQTENEALLEEAMAAGKLPFMKREISKRAKRKDCSQFFKGLHEEYSDKQGG